MNDDSRNQITYDEDWQSVSHSEYPSRIEDYEDEQGYDEKTDENQESGKKKKKSPKQLLVTIQLIVCIVIALTAFVLKSIGGEAYSAAREWYYTQLNNSVIFNGESDSGLDLSKLFADSSKDEA